MCTIGVLWLSYAFLGLSPGHPRLFLDVSGFAYATGGSTGGLSSVSSSFSYATGHSTYASVYVCVYIYIYTQTAFS